MNTTVSFLTKLSSNPLCQGALLPRVFDSLRPHGLHAAHQASLSITNSWSLLKLMSIESVMPSTQSCPTLCDPMNHSTPGLPVHRHLPEFTQTRAPVGVFSRGIGPGPA